MVIFLKNFLAVLLFFYGGNIVAAQKRTLTICIGEISPEALSTSHRINPNINFAPLIDIKYIDPNRIDQIDSVFLVKSIKRLYPAGIPGIGVLDWESKDFENLKFCKQDDRCFFEAINKYKKLLKIAKTTRPKIKWGIYYLPLTFYWNTDSVTYYNQKVMELLNECDVWMPSFYDFFPDETPQQQNKLYYNSNIKSILKMAKKYKKKIYPFVWHRWHDSNATNGLQLIPENQFYEHMTWLLDASFEGVRVDGVVWFGVDDKYYNVLPYYKILLQKLK
jgi:hypothetical protein